MKESRRGVVQRQGGLAGVLCWLVHVLRRCSRSEISVRRQTTPQRYERSSYVRLYELAAGPSKLNTAAAVRSRGYRSSLASSYHRPYPFCSLGRTRAESRLYSSLYLLLPTKTSRRWVVYLCVTSERSLGSCRVQLTSSSTEGTPCTVTWLCLQLVGPICLQLCNVHNERTEGRRAQSWVSW